MSKYYVFDVVEAIAQKVLSDLSSSIVGPTYGASLKVPGIQSVSVNVNRDKQTLLGDGIILGTESSINEVPVQLEIAQRDPEFEALLYGIAAWATATERNLAFTDQSTPNQVGLYLRTNKVGANGKHVVLFIPKFIADSQQLQQQQRNCRTNQISGSAVFTDRRFEVFRDGVQAFERLAYKEMFGDSAALFVVTDNTPPLITTANIVNHPVGNDIVLAANEALNPNTVNKYSVILHTGLVVGSGSQIPVTSVVLSGGTTITINPTSPLLVATDYNVHVTEVVEDVAGNPFAALSGITLVTAP